MDKVVRRLKTRSALAAILAIGVAPLAGQAYRAPRAPDGKPDLNGIWQALNEANYDLEGHMARPAMALRPGPYGPVPAAAVLALGAVGGVPPGVGVVEGGQIPYKPEALATRKKNQEDWLNRDPEIKCYLPGVPRATYLPYPFQILQSASAMTFIYGYAGAVWNIYLKDPGPAPSDSWMGKSVESTIRPSGNADTQTQARFSVLIRESTSNGIPVSIPRSAAARRPMRRKIYRQATDEDGGHRDENRKICSIFLSITW